MAIWRKNWPWIVPLAIVLGVIGNSYAAKRSATSGSTGSNYYTGPGWSAWEAGGLLSDLGSEYGFSRGTADCIGRRIMSVPKVVWDAQGAARQLVTIDAAAKTCATTVLSGTPIEHDCATFPDDRCDANGVRQPIAEVERDCTTTPDGCPAWLR